MSSFRLLLTSAIVSGSVLGTTSAVEAAVSSLSVSSAWLDSFTHTSTLSTKPAPLFTDMKKSYKTAAVCFLGYGDCGDGGYSSIKNDNDYNLDTARQCLNEGYVKLNCNSVQEAVGRCPYNADYGKECRCMSNLISCAEWQQGVGDSCDNKYTKCECISGVSSGAYGCEEYYPAPCSSVCKKAYTDNCRNRTSADTPYGCQTYWSDCTSKCQTAYPDNCRNRTDNNSAIYGCMKYYEDCSSKCETPYTDNCRNRTSATAPYGCQTYWSDCSSKCQTAYPDNCHNRTAVDAPYGCQTYWSDCTSKCQVATPPTCYAAAKMAAPDAKIFNTIKDYRNYTLNGSHAGEKLYITDSDDFVKSSMYIPAGVSLHSAAELTPVCQEKTLTSNTVMIYKNSKINIPLDTQALMVYGDFTFSKNIKTDALQMRCETNLGKRQDVHMTSENNATIEALFINPNASNIFHLNSLTIDNLILTQDWEINSAQLPKLVLQKSATIPLLYMFTNGDIVLRNGNFNIDSLKGLSSLGPVEKRTLKIYLENANLTLKDLTISEGVDVILTNSTITSITPSGYDASIYFQSNDTHETNNIHFGNNSKWLNLGALSNKYYTDAIRFTFAPNSNAYITTNSAAYSSKDRYCPKHTISAQEPTQEAYMNFKDIVSGLGTASFCLTSSNCKDGSCSNILFK